MKNKKYILLPDNSPEILIEQIKTSKKPIFKRFQDQCDRYFQHDLPKRHPDSSITYFGYAVANLSLIYLITKKQDYLDEVKRWLNTAISFEHWGKVRLPDCGLDAGWLLFGLSLSYNWLGDALGREERDRLRSKLLLQGTRIYGFALEKEGKFWSSAYWNSQNWVCFTALVVAGYALREEHPECQLWIDKAGKNFEMVLSVLPEDGSYFSGVRFWRYSIVWLILYFDLIKKYEGIDLFKRCPFMKNTFYFRLYQSAPNLEEIIDFGDCYNRRKGHSIAVYYKLASEYRLGHAQWLANKVTDRFLWREDYDEKGIYPELLPEAFLEFLWYDNTVKGELPDNLPLIKYFEDLGLIVIRTSWAEDAIHFSFKASPPGGHKAWNLLNDTLNEKNNMINNTTHQHPDNNSFILFAYGSFLAVDDGIVHSKRTSNHNTVIIDNKGYLNDGKNDVYYKLPFEVQAKIEEFIHAGNYVYFSGESSKLYSPELQLEKFLRGILYTGFGYFIIMDELDSSAEHTYTWLLHSDHSIDEIDTNVFRTTKGMAELYIYNIEPQSPNTRIASLDNYVSPLSSTPGLVIKNSQKVLRIENQIPSGKMRFLNLLRPDNVFGEIKYTVTPIRNESCIGMVIEWDSYKEVFLWSNTDTDFILYENVSTDANWVSIQFYEERIIRFAIYNGTFLKYEETSMVKLQKKGNVFQDCKNP